MQTKVVYVLLLLLPIPEQTLWQKKGNELFTFSIKQHKEIQEYACFKAHLNTTESLFT